MQSPETPWATKSASPQHAPDEESKWDTSPLDDEGLRSPKGARVDTAGTGPPTEVTSRAQPESAKETDSGRSGGWTLRTALELAYGGKFRDKEAMDTVQRLIVSQDVVLRAASTGVIEVWKIVVEAVEAAGQGLLKKALNGKNLGRLWYTPLDAAISSKEGAMVEEAFACIKAHLTDKEERKIAMKSVLDGKILQRTAELGDVDVWKVVVAELQERGLLEEALAVPSSSTGDTVWTAAVASKEEAMVKEVLTCTKAHLTDQEREKMVMRSVRDGKVLVKAAGSGNISVWGEVVTELKWRSLLEEAMDSRNLDRSGHGTLEAALNSEDKEMVKEVLVCTKAYVTDEAAKEITMTSVRDADALVRVARLGSVELWKMMVEELQGRGLLEEALAIWSRWNGDTIFRAAIDSKEEAMVKEVLTCLKTSLTDEAEKIVITKSVLDNGVLVRAAELGNIPLWRVVVTELQGWGLMKKALMTPSPGNGQTILTAAFTSKAEAMVREVLSCLKTELTEEEEKKTITTSVRDGKILARVARLGSIDLWEMLVEELQERSLLEEALRASTTWNGETTLTAAVASKEGAMVQEVLTCMKAHLTKEAEEEDIMTNIRDRKVLVRVAELGNVGLWKMLVEGLQERSLSEEKKIIMSNVRDENVLTRVARKGNIGLFKVLVEGLQERGLVEEALMTPSSWMGYTTLTAAVDSQREGMVEEVLMCTKKHLTKETEKEIIMKSVWEGDVLVKVAKLGNISLWGTFVEELQERGLLQEAVVIPSTWDSTRNADTILTAAVDSKEEAMVKTVLACTKANLTKEAEKEIIMKNVRDGNVLVRTAELGIVSLWKMLVKELLERRLLEEFLAISSTSWNISWKSTRSADTILTAAVASKAEAMVEEVIACVKAHLPDEKGKGIFMESVRDGNVLFRAAERGNLALWKMLTEELEGRGVLAEALVVPSIREGETILTAAVDSKEEAMVAEVLTCVESHLTSEAVTAFLLEDRNGSEMLVLAAKSGNIEMWRSARDFIEAKSLLSIHEALTLTLRCGHTVLTAALTSGRLEMVKEVLELLRNIPESQVKAVLLVENHEGNTVLSLPARSGDVEMWGIVVDALVEYHLLEEALVKRTKRGPSVAAVAIECSELVMMWKALERVQQGAARGHQDPEALENELLLGFRNNRGTRRNRSRILSFLLGQSIRPSPADLAKISPTVDKAFENWCLDTIVDADNPFIPGMALSVLLAKRAEQASEGEQRKLRALRERVDSLMLEILERLPQTVRGFPGGIERCSILFEPEGSAQRPTWLPGPLNVALQEREQMEVFCKAPLVMDYLSLVFKMGLPDLLDTNKLRKDREELKFLAGRGREGLLLKQSQIVGETLGDGSFLQGTNRSFEDLNLLPGAQFIAAGMVALPRGYYTVPAMRMVLGFVVYACMLAFFFAAVLLHDEGAITWGEMVFGVYLAAGICTEIREVWTGFGNYMIDRWNALDVLGLALSLGGCTVRWIDDGNPWGRALYALSAPFMVSRVLFFAQILPLQGPMIQIIFQTMREMLEFAMVLLVVLLGFTMSFHALFRNFDTYGETCLNLLKAMLGEVSLFDEFPDERYEAVATVLLVVYLIIITIMMLNLLIAVLSTSHAKVQEHAEQEYRLLKARLIQHYRLVVRDDLLPAPFNLVQLPLRWHRKAKRSVGCIVFWAVLGPVAVVGGAFLWIVSAFLKPLTRLPEAWTFDILVYQGDEVGAWCHPFSRGCRAIWIYVLLFIRRVVGCPLELLGLWITQPVVVGKSVFRSEDNLVTGPGRVKPVDATMAGVNTILRQQQDGATVRDLLEFLVDPLSDETVREDERRRSTSVEHLKLLRNRLECQNKLLQDHFDGKIELKVGALESKVDILQASIDKVHAAVANVASSNASCERCGTEKSARTSAAQEKT
ncbi:unnamed protein product [Scytosiphon promiscuus]